jgi:hypothetical protein
MGSSNKKTKNMTNEPILKCEKMNINQATTRDYTNARPVGPKKTNPFQDEAKTLGRWIVASFSNWKNRPQYTILFLLEIFIHLTRR